MKSKTVEEVIATDFASRARFLERLKSDGLEGARPALAPLLDATLLKWGFLFGDLQDLLILASRSRVRAVCVPPQTLDRSLVAELQECEISIATVVNFPCGYQRHDSVIDETERAVRAGATEIDFVHPIYLAKNHEWRELENFSRRLVESFPNVVFKVILETGLLSMTELQTSIRCHALAGVHVMKTCTGFGPRGVTVADIQTIKATLQSMGLGDTVGIKASGGVSDLAFAGDLIAAGATRLGTSQTAHLLSLEAED